MQEGLQPRQGAAEQARTTAAQREAGWQEHDQKRQEQLAELVKKHRKRTIVLVVAMVLLVMASVPIAIEIALRL